MSAPAVLVTGARRRVGLALARSVLLAGQPLIAHSRLWDAARREAFAGEVADLSRPAWTPWAWEFESAWPGLPDRPIGELVLSASHFERGEDWHGLNDDAVAREARRLQQHFGVNVAAPWELSVRAAAVGALRSVVLVLDTYYDRPLPGHAAYLVSRAAGAGLVRALAAELAPIRVNAVAPGTVLWSERVTEARAETEAQAAARTVLGRVGAAAHVVQAVGYLRDADYVTGEILRVDGGRWKA